MRAKAVVFLALIASAQSAKASTALSLQVISGQFGGVQSYSAYAMPSFFLGDPGFPYHTGVIESADHQYVTTSTSGPGWTFQEEPRFSTFDGLIGSLEQPWTIIFDGGLATERDYTTTLDLGTWPQTGLGIPSINVFPSGSGVFNSTTPTIPMTLPSEPSTFDIRLSDLSILNDLLVDTSIPNSTTSYHISQALVPGQSYNFWVFGNNISLPVAFSVPVDGQDNPLTSPQNWGTGGLASAETSINFAITPEPRSFYLLLSGMMVAIAILWRGRIKSLRAI